MFSNNMKKSTETPSVVNIISSSTQINGDIVSKSDIRIDGSLKGSVKIDGKLVVGDEGIIDGDVFCSDADISGSVKGKITVSQLLSLKASAKLDGDIVTNKLAIEPGCSFSGSCSMGAVIKDIKHIEKQQKEQGNQEKTA